MTKGGIEVCQQICNDKIHPKTDKPYVNINIISDALMNKCRFIVVSF